MYCKRLYKSLESRQIAIFESPTGTGKSLSIICGALKWLSDAQSKSESDHLKAIEDEFHLKHQESQEPQWVLEFKLKKIKEDALNVYRIQKENEKNRRERLNELKRLELFHQKSKRFVFSLL